MTRLVAWVLVLLAWPTSVAAAAEPGDRVAIAPFRGPAAVRLQGVVENALMNHFYVIPDFSVLDSARRQGIGLVIDEDYATVGRELSVRAFVSAEVQRRAGWRVQVIVRRGDTGTPIGQFVVADRRLSRLERALARKTPDRILTLVSGLRRHLSRPVAAPSLPPTAPPALETPPSKITPPHQPVQPESPSGRVLAAARPKATAAPEGRRERDEHLDLEEEGSTGNQAEALAEDEELLAEENGADADRDETVVNKRATPAGSAPTVAFHLTVDGRISSRSFTYNQNYTGLPNYRLSGAMSGAVRAVVRPGGLVTPSLAPVGVVASLEYGLGVTSRFADSEQGLKTEVRSYAVGASYALEGPFGSLEPSVTYGNHRFITGNGDTKAPDLDLTLVAAGVDGRLTVTPRTALLGHAAYLHGLSAGRMQADRFPRVTVAGMSAEAGLAIAVVPEVEVRATVGVRRFGFDMNAAKDDALIAGGAIDQTTWAGLGLAYRPQP